MTTYDEYGNELKSSSSQLARYDRPLYCIDQWVNLNLLGHIIPFKIMQVSRDNYNNCWSYKVEAPQSEYYLDLYGVQEKDILGYYEGETPRKPVKAANE